jgi:predicted transcriptional regulator
LDDDVWKKVISDLKKVFKGIVVNDIELPEAESEIDKLKRVIATSGELRVSELGRLMSIGNNKVHALMIELLQEGWLKKESRAYEINVDEEELNKWRESGT